MESLTPLNAPSSPSQKLEIETSKENPLETQLFLKTVDAQGPESVSIGVWKDKKFTLSKDLKNVDLQQVAVKILKNEGKVSCSPDEQALLLKAFLDKGISLNVSDQDKKTLLHHATRTGNLELMKMLVDQGGMNVNAKDDIGRTPLSYAAEQGNKDIVEWLLDRGADVNAVSDDLATPSFSSTPDSSAPVPQYQKSAHWHMTPLHYAAMEGKTEIAKLLVSRGADANVQNSEGQTPVHFAAGWGHAEIIPSLITTKAINLPNNNGYTPLHLAIFNGQPEIVKTLLERGADPNIPDSADLKASPLHYSASLPSTEIAELLLDNKAKIDAVDSKNQQPIHYSIDNGYTIDCLHLLAARGADINAKGGDEEQTPLVRAERHGRESYVLALLTLGADPNIITRYGTALNASSRQNPQVAYSETTKTLSEECKRRKQAALRFGIGGYSKVSVSPDPNPELFLERYTRSGGAKMITDTMKVYTPDTKEPEKALFEEAWVNALGSMQEIPEKEFHQLSEEAQSKVIDNYLKNLNEGKAIAIPTGWTGHATYMVFIKTKDGLLFIDCNRGERSVVEEGGITIHSVKNPDELNKDTLRRLLIGNDRTFTESFLRFRLGSTKTEHIGLKDQKAETCTFTSAKTAAFATLYVFFKNKGLDDATALEHTKKLYRSWTQFDRASALNEMLDEYEKKGPPSLYSRDDQFLVSIASKMKTAPPIHPDYARAHQRLMDFLEKHAPTPWQVNNQVDASYRSPLTYAVYTKQKGLIELMLKKGCDINAPDPGNWTPLQRAISEGDKDMVSFLINHGADLQTFIGGELPIHIAIRLNRQDITISLLKKMKKQGIDLNVPDASGLPLMHYAVAANARGVMDFLLANGCDLNVRNAFGYTTLQNAITSGKSEAVNYLIEKGVSLDEDPQNGMHPLQTAIYMGQMEIAKKLADQMKQKGLSLEQMDTYHKYTPLSLAAYRKDQKLFDHLQGLGTDWSISSQFLCLKSALIDASDPQNLNKSDSYIDFLKYLFDKRGAMVHSDGNIGYRPIDVCFQVDAPLPIIKFVIDKMKESGVDINRPDYGGKSIFDYAKDYGRVDVCNYISPASSYLFAKPPTT